MSTIAVEQNVYAAQFASVLERLPGKHLPWLERLRQKGMDDFLSLGFPTTKLEDWKYTNVASIRRMTFERAADRPLPSIPDFDAQASPRLVFINGRFVPGLSAADARLNKFHMLPISDALRDPERRLVIEKHLGRYTKTSDHAFAAWNTAFFTDGAYIEVPGGLVCEQPVHLVFISAGDGDPRVCHARNLIVAHEASQFTFIEKFFSLTDSVYLTNTVTEIAAKPGAVISYYKIERECSQGFHVAVVDARLESDASLTSYSFSLGGSLVRNDLNVLL